MIKTKVFSLLCTSEREADIKKAFKFTAINKKA